MRAEQRWVGLAYGIGSRVVRFLSGFIITTACLRTFGPATWGTVVIALAASDLVLNADFAMPELCAYESARADDQVQLRARLSQALWLAAPPAVLGSLALLGAAQFTQLWFHGASSERDTMSALLSACACGAPLVLGANYFANTLQGLGRLREMNTAHGLSAVFELGLVLALLALRVSVVDVQWARTASQGGRLLGMVIAFRRLGLALPTPVRPDRAILREMARYCAGLSLLKIIGSAIGRSAVPIAQAYTTTMVIGSYDAVDRLGAVLQRATNPVADSLFQRLVRGFDVTANERQRDIGRRDFMAGTLIVVGLSAFATLTTLNSSRWLFPLWLGRDLASVPIAFAPWIMATWSLSLGASMCGALLVARARIRECVIIHALALFATITTTSVVGALAKRIGYDPRFSLLIGPLAGTSVVATGLTVCACRSAGVRFTRLMAQVGATWTPAWLAIISARLWPNTLATAASTTIGLFGIMVVMWRAEPIRTLARDFREPGLPLRSDSQRPTPAES